MNTIEVTPLATERLILRQPRAGDAAEIVRLIGDPRVALKLSAVPHPYFLDHALEWLERTDDEHRLGKGRSHVIERNTVPGLIGVISLTIREDRCSAEVGYWIGVPFWRRGFMTEVLREVLRHGFEDLGLLYINAGHMSGNPASGKVMQKAGMRFENITRGGIVRAGVAHDRVNHGLFADEWRALHH